MRFAIRILSAVLLLSSNANADSAPTLGLWPDEYGALDDKHVKEITVCLAKSDKSTCANIPYECPDLANWGLCAARGSSNWSAVGKEILESLKHIPGKNADLLEKEQLAWVNYINATCDIESSTATYADDEQDGSHPPYYDMVTRNSCLYRETQQRVLELSRRLSSN
ncbi:MAG: hypothetical protein DI582_03770 [Azospirillum brasilense]|nr:MAG: hypothetical protein DI582_03770 [Azospirillum brasilense]